MTEWVTPQRLTSGVPAAPDFQAWREGDLWVIDVPGYGITQAESEDDIPRMAADLIEQTRAAKIAEFDAAEPAPESAVFTCPWDKCPHGADCVHADWQRGDDA